MNILNLTNCAAFFGTYDNVVFLKFLGLIDLNSLQLLIKKMALPQPNKKQEQAVVYDLREWDSIDLDSVKFIRANLKEKVEKGRTLSVVLSNMTYSELKASLNIIANDSIVRRSFVVASDMVHAVKILSDNDFPFEALMDDYQHHFPSES